MLSLSLLNILTPTATIYYRDHDIYCWWDLIRSKQLFSVSVCHAEVFAGFSGHGNPIHGTKLYTGQSYIRQTNISLWHKIIYGRQTSLRYKNIYRTKISLYSTIIYTVNTSYLVIMSIFQEPIYQCISKSFLISKRFIQSSNINILGVNVSIKWTNILNI